MCKKMITVDFDALERNVIEKVFFMVRLKFICRIVKCKITKSKKGLHIYIKESREFWDRFVIRILLLDDPMRLEIDYIRHISGWHEIEETLFNSKCQKEYCYEEEEVSLDELDRILFVKFSPIFVS